MLKKVIKTTGFYSTLWIVSGCCKVIACVIILPLYILHGHEKNAGKHQLLYTNTYEVQLHLRGIAIPVATATPTRYSFMYEVQLHLIGTATPTRYSYSYEIKLHLGELVHLKARWKTFADDFLIMFIFFI